MKFRELDVDERPKVNAFYQLTTYKRPVSDADRVFVAEQAASLYGAVRIERSEGVQVLRGMYMHPDHVRKGIGRKLLLAIEPVLAETDAFCIPGTTCSTSMARWVSGSSSPLMRRRFCPTACRAILKKAYRLP